MNLTYNFLYNLSENLDWDIERLLSEISEVIDADPEGARILRSCLREKIFAMYESSIDIDGNIIEDDTIEGE